MLYEAKILTTESCITVRIKQFLQDVISRMPWPNCLRKNMLEKKTKTLQQTVADFYPKSNFSCRTLYTY
jgi:hypothetical protein